MVIVLRSFYSLYNSHALDNSETQRTKEKNGRSTAQEILMQMLSLLIPFHNKARYWPIHVFHSFIYLVAQMPESSRRTHVREVVKTTICEQDPPNQKKEMVVSAYTPLPQPQKMVSLLHSHPSNIQHSKMTMSIKLHFSCLSSNTASC